MKNHDNYIKRLARPYGRRPKRKKGFKRSEVSKLKRIIGSLNGRSRNKGDFIQSKQQYKDKISKVVKTPKTYYYGTNLIRIKAKMEQAVDFVMKPNHLSRGIGIRVLHRDGNKYTDINGDVLTIAELMEECKVLLRVRRYKGIRAIIIEERIISHPNFKVFGMADIRMIYFANEFLFGVARYPSNKSKGYGNIIRGANWGIFIHPGKFISDNRFKPTTIKKGNIPFFNKLNAAGQAVTKSFGLMFQAVDMTVNDKGLAVVIESEALPQIDYYLTDHGTLWLRQVLGVNHTTRSTSKRRKSTNLIRYFPKHARYTKALHKKI